MGLCPACKTGRFKFECPLTSEEQIMVFLRSIVSVISEQSWFFIGDQTVVSSD